MKKLFLTTGLMFVFVGFAQATEITKTSATGTTVKFTATLDAPLTTGNKVKIDFGKGGLKVMRCNATTCTLSSNALPIGVSTATYKIGIYNARNVLQGSTSDGTYVISFDAPAATQVSNDINLGGTPSNPRKISFQAKNKIDTNFLHNYFTYHAKEGETIYIYTIFDSPLSDKWIGQCARGEKLNVGLFVNGSTVSCKGNLVYTFEKDGIYTFSFVFASEGEGNVSGIFEADVVAPVKKPVVVEEKPVVVIPPPVVELKPAIYTKIANDGSELPDSAQLGANPKDWACTRDNETGLIWEVKTRDGGLRNFSKSYTWEQSSDFVVSVNTQKMCGATDWRLPTKEELKTLVYCSVGSYSSLGKDSKGYICNSNYSSYLGTESPTINKTYFPNTQKNWFWSSSVESYTFATQWLVDFSDGKIDYSSRYDVNYVRLVR